MDQRGPGLDLGLGGGGIAIPGHVDQGELRRRGEEDQLLRAARRVRRARERASPGERIDQARLADIGASGKGDLHAAHRRQRFDRPRGPGKLPVAREQLAAGFGFRAREGGGKGGHLVVHDNVPLMTTCRS